MEILIGAVVVAVASRSGSWPRPRCWRAGPVAGTAPAKRARDRPGAARRRAPSGASPPRTARAPSGAPTCCGLRSACGRARRRSRAALAELGERERGLSAGATELDEARERHLRELERVAGHVRVAGPPAAAQGGRGPDAPRPRQGRPPDRGGDQARRRPPRAQHPLGRHAAARRRPRGRDDGLGRAAARRRHEGPHHRPRGPQHPRARAPHRRRLHHRRHARSGDPLRLRRRPPRDRPDDAREAAPGRPHPPGAHRGDLLPGEVGARGAHRRVRRAGVLRRERPGARPRPGRPARPPEVPHVATARTCSRTRSSARTSPR